MPRKQKVVEQQSEAPLPETQVIEQTIDETTIETTLPPEAPPVLADETAAVLPPDEVKEVKVKAKRKAQPKKIQVKEIEQTPINIPEEPKESTEDTTKQKKVKTLEQVKCDTCEKDMTKRTLRYHHKCPGEVIKREELPVKKRVKKETKQEPKEETKVPEKPTLTNTYHERLQKALEKRHENIQKLASQIA
jgi:hypothetical protein